MDSNITLDFGKEASVEDITSSNSRYYSYLNNPSKKIKHLLSECDIYNIDLRTKISNNEHWNNIFSENESNDTFLLGVKINVLKIIIKDEKNKRRAQQKRNEVIKELESMLKFNDQHGLPFEWEIIFLMSSKNELKDLKYKKRLLDAKLTRRFEKKMNIKEDIKRCEETIKKYLN